MERNPTVVAMKLLLFFPLFLHASHAHLNINDYFDEALKQFVSKLVQAGDDVVPLGDDIMTGGFIFTAPKMRNLSTLKRVGNAQLELSRLYNSPTVTVELSLDELVIEGEKIDGPKDYLQPKIIVRNNTIGVSLSAFIDPRKKCCGTETSVKFTELSAMFLNGTLVDDWIDEFYLPFQEYHAEFKVLSIPLRSIFTKHFNLCKALADKGYRMFLDNSSRCYV